MLSVSFYLLTPDAKTQSQVYVSISDKTSRLRFSTGQSFLTEYCNIRKKKGGKDLVKKGTPFFLEYNESLRVIRDALIRIHIEQSKKGAVTLGQVRDVYYTKTGRLEDQSKVTLDSIVKAFIQGNETQWTDLTRKKINATYTHLKTYEEKYGTPERYSDDFLRSIRDNYFVRDKKMSNSSTNKYIKITKQILKYVKKKGLIDYDAEVEYLDEIEPFKIALKETEVEKLLEIDLEPKLARVRDLFAVEVLTGQRFSDLAKLLDAEHLSSTSIQIYQQKTNERVSIPLHPRLKKHLTSIFKKYPEGLPVMSNQNFNEHLKEICKQAGFVKRHSWVTLIGKKQVNQSDFRYNLVTSHTGRRTFCTLSLKRGIRPEEIMKVTGHKNYEQFKQYVKVDDEHLESAYEMDLLKK